MADFCNQCAVDVFGRDFGDLKGLSKEADTENGLYASALCEGCGPIHVDHLGVCTGGCDKKHTHEAVPNILTDDE